MPAAGVREEAAEMAVGLGVCCLWRKEVVAAIPRLDAARSGEEEERRKAKENRLGRWGL